eukprot:m.117535 g.117535  ORF g.117535 m.117535 type:complete len:555 (+) comp14252_c0_seq5:300-1964(+)
MPMEQKKDHVRNAHIADSSPSVVRRQRMAKDWNYKRRSCPEPNELFKSADTKESDEGEPHTLTNNTLQRHQHKTQGSPLLNRPRRMSVLSDTSTTSIDSEGLRRNSIISAGGYKSIARRLSTSSGPAAFGRQVPHHRMDDRRVIDEKYEFGDELGKGSFGAVRKVLNIETSEYFACKVVHKEKAGTIGVRMLDMEIAVLKSTDHPHIVRLVEVNETPKDTFLFMELCEGGSLSTRAFTMQNNEKVPSFTTAEVAEVIRQVAGAVAYLHDNGVVHRDLKNENVILKRLDSILCKVCDFGLAALKTKDSDLQMVCGTPHYMAPEILANQSSYSPLCDIWSIGVMLHVLLSGNFPFVRRETESQLSSIRRTELTFESPVWKNFEDSYKVLIRRLLQIDPAKRVTAKELLEDPWVSGRSDNASLINSMNVLDMMKAFSAEQELSGKVIDSDAEETPSPLQPPSPHLEKRMRSGRRYTDDNVLAKSSPPFAGFSKEGHIGRRRQTIDVSPRKESKPANLQLKYREGKSPYGSFKSGNSPRKHRNTINENGGALRLPPIV